jgi:5-formyltetrahydrofolate cyclo-ligase
MSSVAEDKAALRASLRQARAERSPSEESSARLSEQLGQFCIDNKLRTVAAYFPIQGEPDIREFLSWALKNGIKVLLPSVAGESLNWVHFDGTTEFGELGFEEGTGNKAQLSSADAAFIPAMAVDFAGNRLGKGKGYYDRALAGTKVKTIAVVFDEEILMQIPAEPHDQKVNAAISASKLIWFKR